MPVYSPDDLKGKPFRGVPIQLWTSMIKGFGAIPTPVEVGVRRFVDWYLGYYG